MNDHTDAHTQSPMLLLESAARLIERALIQLNTTNVGCACCHRTLYADREQAQVYERLTDLPSKLRTCVDKLSNPIESSVGYIAAKKELDRVASRHD